MLAKPEHGAVPKVVGLPLRAARARLARLDLEARVTEIVDGRRPFRVVEQRPKWGVAAAPGMTITLTVSRGSGTASS